MPRAFVSSFLLPLVRGGSLHVGRPLGPASVERLTRVASTTSGVEAEAVALLAAARRDVAVQFLRFSEAPSLDEATLRLGAAVHDLLVLVHPAIEGPGGARRQARIAAAAQTLAAVGAPASAEEVVERHSLLARVPEIARTDSTVSFWLGRETFVGRVPPPRVMALPSLRRVRVDAVRRAWLRDIGVPAVAREAVLALAIASPLGEALDPLRLDPPLCWSRILPVLRAPALGRIVAGRMLEVGLDRAGGALAAALLRFASFQDPPGGESATPEAVAFGLRFLAHLVWLDVLFEAGPAPAPVAIAAGPLASAGGALALMVTAAAVRETSLVWPRDVSPSGDLGRAFAARLDALAARARVEPASALDAAHGVAAFAASAAVAHAGDAGAPNHI